MDDERSKRVRAENPGLLLTRIDPALIWNLGGCRPLNITDLRSQR